MAPHASQPTFIGLDLSTRPDITAFQLPPRRLSVHDEGYDPAIGARLRVLLDGVSQDGRCEAYDIDAGTVIRCKLDEQGHIYAEGDEVARETVTGKVEVSWRAEASTPTGG